MKVVTSTPEVSKELSKSKIKTKTKRTPVDMYEDG